MAFATTERINKISTYEQAKAKYDSTKPLRTSGLRPLGSRRDANRYYLELNDKGEYEAVLYNTPVVTFRPNNEIEIRTHSFETALTMDFVSNLLGIHTRRTRGQCVFKIGEVKFVTSGQNASLLLHSEDGKYTVIGRQRHKQYVMSRTGANNVRKKYSEFRAYLKGFLSLRTQTVEFPETYYADATTRDVVDMSTKELVELLGAKKYDDSWTSKQQLIREYVDIEPFNPLTVIGVDSYEEANKAFVELIKNGQDDATRSLNFYKAVAILAALTASPNRMRAIRVDKEYIRVTPKEIVATLDEIQFKWHSDEVFVIAEVKEGVVPNYKYNSWVRHPIV